MPGAGCVGDAAAQPVQVSSEGVRVRSLGLADYEPTWRAMQAFTANRDTSTPDELWLVEHPPVYTLGLAGKPEHLLQTSDIPLIKIDRGGQITYHGPGQAVVYLLIDLPRRKLMVRQLVNLMEQAIIDVLAGWSIVAERREGAPGVYVADAKIGALGLKINRGCSYHGLSLNVDMDLTPFTWINPCGYEGLRTVQIKDYGVDADLAEVHRRVADQLLALLEERFPPSQGEQDGIMGEWLHAEAEPFADKNQGLVPDVA